MKCGNCKVEIDHRFVHSIKNNQCPACGQSIMKKAKLAAFLSLRSLLDDQIPIKGFDVDQLTSIIMANFNVTQVFEKGTESTSKNEEDEGIIEEETEDVIEKEDDTDAEYKEQQMKEAKNILRKMRDEALNGAVKDRYGFGDEDNLLLPDEEMSQYELTDKMVKDQRRDIVLSGSGGKGSFSRSE